MAINNTTLSHFQKIRLRYEIRKYVRRMLAEKDFRELAEKVINDVTTQIGFTQEEHETVINQPEVMNYALVELADALHEQCRSHVNHRFQTFNGWWTRD